MDMTKATKRAIRRLSKDEIDLILGNTDSVECSVPCIRCKRNDRVTYTLKQTRGGDEASTPFIVCDRCKFTFRL